MMFLTWLETICYNILNINGNAKIPDTDYATKIVISLPKKFYKQEIKSILNDLSMDLVDIKQLLYDQFTVFVMPCIDEYNKCKKKKNQEQDIALTAKEQRGREGYKCFNNKCHNCGKQGHKKF